MVGIQKNDAGNRRGVQDSGGNTASHWSEYREESAGYGLLKLTLLMFRALPAPILKLCAFPVSLCYYIFSKRARDESRRYLKKAAAKLRTEGRILAINPLAHILAFSLTVIEKMEAWGGKIALKNICFQEDDCGDLMERLENGEGALLLCSHLGNAELLRALAGFNRTGVSRNIPVTSIVDFSVTGSFNRMLRELNPESMVRLIGAGGIGPETVIVLEERLEAGELVVIAGDRTSAHTRNKYLSIPFLDENAPFAYGPFLLAGLLGVPAYFVFALRRKDLSLSSLYDLHVHKSPVNFACGRKEREDRIVETARLFVEKLEYYCKQHPLQWYNFYDFWAEPKLPKGK
jgi:predicted LPLAT superfamily acyltransferase